MLKGLSNGVWYKLIKADFKNKTGLVDGLENCSKPCWCSFEKIIKISIKNENSTKNK